MTLEERLRAAGVPLPMGAGALPAMTLEEAKRLLTIELNRRLLPEVDPYAHVAPEPSPGDWHEAMDPRREDDGD